MSRCFEVNYLNDQQNWSCSWYNNCISSWAEDGRQADSGGWPCSKSISAHWRLNSDQTGQMLPSSADQGQQRDIFYSHSMYFLLKVSNSTESNERFCDDILSRCAKSTVKLQTIKTIKLHVNQEDQVHQVPNKCKLCSSYTPIVSSNIFPDIKSAFQHVFYNHTAL